MSRGIVFVTRKFPPQVGGMETMSADVWRVLGSDPNSVLVANRRGNRALPLWVPVAAGILLFHLARRRPQAVVFGDALTWMLMGWLAALFRLPAVVLLMGLDLTWERHWYQTAVRLLVPRADHAVAISRSTARLAAERGVPESKLSVLPLGLDVRAPTPAQRSTARRAVRSRLGATEDDFVIATVGRLVERKGVRWFVSEVMPDLPSNCVVAVAGSGPQAGAIGRSARDSGVGERIRLMGQLTDAERDELMIGADLFVQPNVPVAGDVEGFGLVVIEAALVGTPVIASDLEGLRDAVLDGRTGSLLPPGDADAWTEAVRRAAAEGPLVESAARSIASAAAEEYSAAAFERRLLDLLSSVGLDLRT